MPVPDHFFKWKTYLIRNAAEAAASQGTSLTPEKVDIAITQALSTWSSVSPISFIPVAPRANPDIDIHFVDNGYTLELGNALIEINIGNSLFVDLYNETNAHPTYVGPWDLIAEIAHEVGHNLGLDHPPLIPNTDMETNPDALMSRSLGPEVLERFLKLYDINEVQRLHGYLHFLDSPVLCSLQTDLLPNSGPQSA
jgi:hypothetical protein